MKRGERIVSLSPGCRGEDSCKRELGETAPLDASLMRAVEDLKSGQVDGEMMILRLAFTHVALFVRTLFTNPHLTVAFVWSG